MQDLYEMKNTCFLATLAFRDARTLLQHVAYRQHQAAGEHRTNNPNEYAELPPLPTDVLESACGSDQNVAIPLNSPQGPFNA